MSSLKSIYFPRIVLYVQNFHLPNRLLQLMKDSPSKVDQIGVKVRTANDAVQSIKQLRKEIVEIMSQLLCLAKTKNPKGMLPLCNEMITKTRSLLNIWEPSLVEEAFAFIEKHRIINDTTDTSAPMKLSPFRNITQQLGALELKSPDLEDFASPTSSVPITDLWSSIARRNTSPCVDIPKVDNNNSSAWKDMKNFKIYRDETVNNHHHQQHDSFEEIKLDNRIATEYKNASFSLPPNCGTGDTENGLMFSETHFDVSGEITSLPLQTIHSLTPVPKSDIRSIDTTSQSKTTNVDEYERMKSMEIDGTFVTENQLNESKNEILYNSTEFDENGHVKNCSIAFAHNGTFLDTKVRKFSIER